MLNKCIYVDNRIQYCVNVYTQTEESQVCTNFNTIRSVM